MILSTLFSFLGGTTFRMLWGEISAWWNKKQDHEFEIERIKIQEGIDAKQHERNLEAIRVQADLGIKTVTVQADNHIREIEAAAWATVSESTTKQTGIRWVDAWNATIRPGVATWAVVMMTLSEFTVIILSESSWSVASAALGLYLADRTLLKRGK